MFGILSRRAAVSLDGGTVPRPVAHLANLDLNLLVARVSAEAACEMLHKALPRKPSWTWLPALKRSGDRIALAVAGRL
jgi:hypothetical protein